ncbi:UNVERIFIED_CONTAM: hypothetical protein RMT77_017045 [Armadillidium vulgare]
MEKFKQAFSDSSNYVVNKIPSFRYPWQPRSKRHFRMSVVTGDKRGSGTDANVFIIVHDAYNQKSKKLEPKHTFNDDHERGTTTHFDFDVTAGVEPPFLMIEVWRDDWGTFQFPFASFRKFFSGGKDKEMADWFLDRVEIRIKDEHREHFKKLREDVSENTIQTTGNSFDPNQDVWVFPVHRWISENLHYFIPLYDSILPQYDHRKEFREEELKHKKENYVLNENETGGLIQVRS